MVNPYRDAEPCIMIMASCRDMFVEVSLRPKLSHMRRGMLETLLDETDQVSMYVCVCVFITHYIIITSSQPTQDMFEKAYHFRKMRLQDTYFW